jgi:hypothetical protein
MHLLKKIAGENYLLYILVEHLHPLERVNRKLAYIEASSLIGTCPNLWRAC